MTRRGEVFMKAMVLERFGDPMVLKNVPEPSIGK
jgi:hypothetical protein